MKITEELSQKILDCIPQLQAKFGIKIGYVCPFEAVCGENCTFIIEQEGVWTEKECIEGDIHLINPKQTEEREDTSISKFLQDFNQWLTEGTLVIHQAQHFKNYEWKPTGDGQYNVKEKWVNQTHSYCKQLSELPKDLQDHIREKEHVNR